MKRRHANLKALLQNPGQPIRDKFIIKWQLTIVVKEIGILVFKNKLNTMEQQLLNLSTRLDEHLQLVQKITVMKQLRSKHELIIVKIREVLKYLNDHPEIENPLAHDFMADMQN